MNTASSNATSASSTIHPIALLSRYAGTLAIAALAASCTIAPRLPSAGTEQEPSRARLQRVAFSEIPGWTTDTLFAALPAFVVECPVLIARAETTAIWRDICATANGSALADEASVRAFFELHFTPYRVSDTGGREIGMVTGYYEPLLRGSRRPDERFRYPLYAPPDDLLSVELSELLPELKNKRVRGRVEDKRIVPYWARGDIDAGLAPLRGKELVWVDDALDAFFVQIQGSARVSLAEGGSMRIGYADQNGRAYRPIGQILVERGELELESVTMQSIRQWARAHPDELPSLLAENPSYVFFREVVPDPAAPIDGPIGSLGVPLLAQRTIAVDPRAIPLGTPVFLATTFPLTERPLARLVMAQDSGGAIRGALRADFFWGFGDEAGEQAGRMRQPGRMWILWPKGVPLP